MKTYFCEKVKTFIFSVSCGLLWSNRGCDRKRSDVSLLLAILIMTLIALSAEASEYQYMAVCTDGHGVLTDWLDSRDAANNVGKEHELSTKGHRWDIYERSKPENNEKTEFNIDKPVHLALSSDACFKFYSIGSFKKEGLRNTCNTCRIAVINFIFSGGSNELREFKVPGNSSIEIEKPSNYKSMEIIDNKDCEQKG